MGATCVCVGANGSEKNTIEHEVPNNEIESHTMVGSFGLADRAASSSCILEEHLPGVLLEFLTDVEGNWDYFMHFVERSSILYWEGEERGAFGPGRLSLIENGMLVFGGDALDKGPGDIRFTKSIIDLKARFPERVFIILGNRDINKLRYHAELLPDVKSLHPLPWDANADALEPWLEKQGFKPGPVSTLKWMLHFSGCQNTTFATRKFELALLQPNLQVTDMDVVRSYRSAVDPKANDPWMLRLLEVGCLAVVIGDALFVHGGVHDAAIKVVPGQDGIHNDLKEWVTKLNRWKDEQLEEFRRYPGWQCAPDGTRWRGGEQLILYGTPGFKDHATVVYHNPFRNGNPHLLPPEVEAHLVNNGIRRVFSGHQPHGENPAVVRHPKTGLLQIFGDTSYSNMRASKLFNKANMRGDAVSLVTIGASTVHISGVLTNGRTHSCTLNTDQSEDVLPDALVGRQLRTGAWIKAVLDGDEEERNLKRIVSKAAIFNGERSLVQCVLGEGFTLATECMHVGKASFNLAKDFLTQELTILSKSAIETIPAESLCLEDYSQNKYAPPEILEAHLTKSASIALKFNRAEFERLGTYVISIQGVVATVKDVSLNKSSEELRAAIIEKINLFLTNGKRIVFVTNNSKHSRKAVARRLIEWGIKLDEDNGFRSILNTAFTAAWFLKRYGIQKPFIICSHPGLLEELKAMGMNNYVATITDAGEPKREYLEAVSYQRITELVAKHPDVDGVVIGWDDQLTTLKVAVAATYVRWSREGQVGSTMDVVASIRSSKQKVPIVACSTDASGILGTTPSTYCEKNNFNNRSVWTVGNGPMSHIVCELVGEQITAYNVGKPSDLMLEALGRPAFEDGYEVDFHNACMIGDSMATDIEMANRGGMRSLLVHSGKTETWQTEEMDMDSLQKPTWILDSLADA